MPRACFVKAARSAVSFAISPSYSSRTLAGRMSFRIGNSFGSFEEANTP